jgi:hypothetical protein
MAGDELREHLDADPGACVRWAMWNLLERQGAKAKHAPGLCEP